MIGVLLMNMQDDYAVQSFERGIAAQEAGAFTWEIVPVSIFFIVLVFVLYKVDTLSVKLVMQVEVSGGRGRPSTIVDKDEGLGKVIDFPFWL